VSLNSAASAKTLNMLLPHYIILSQHMSNILNIIYAPHLSSFTVILSSWGEKIDVAAVSLQHCYTRVYSLCPITGYCDVYSGTHH
jgi:hypothetical protein